MARSLWNLLLGIGVVMLTGALIYFSQSPALQVTVLALGMVIVVTTVIALATKLTNTLNTLQIEVMATETRLENSVHSLGRKINEIKKLGVHRFSQRGDFDNDYWLDAITEVKQRGASSTKLVLVGRTLEKWVEQPFTEVFRDALVKILSSGGTVRMVTLDPAGEAGKMYTNHSMKDLTRGAQKVEEFLEKEVKPKVSPSDWMRLETKTMRQVPLTFTMFRSDGLTWFSPYLSLTDTQSNIALACQSNSPIAVALVQDVDDMWRLQPEPRRH